MNVPVTPPEWREFLSAYSDEYLRLEDDDEDLEPAQRENRWLGYEPATAEAVREAEVRLGVALPPEYRNFLLTSNGWRNIDPEVEELFPVDEIGWFADLEAELLSWWDHDKEVVAQVKPCLLVSAPGSCAVYWLLDPTTIGPDGEWAAYEWATGDGSLPASYPSFGALVASARKVFENWKAEGSIVKDSGERKPAAGSVPEDSGVRLSAQFDHLALTVADRAASVAFYTSLLGMEAAASDDRNTMLTLGDRIHLRVSEGTPGNTELCFVVDDPVLLLIDRLRERGVKIEAGPISEIGARGPMYSLHLRDPDRNLVKLCNYLD
ncbi:SMI1/KNR4 family protein [Amycolatopsis jejuensis]|uniref:SMI1/KNR4 family protein n=1 Tax=Amycolatopsis jejuensis TaxID=330084 RepID=UPI00138E1833|nr:SMI1/KNR4 family protein [Amycolatopsis jejuensis]